MQFNTLVLIGLACFRAVGAAASSAEASPVGKVLDMLTDLQAKVTKEGEEAKAAFTEFSEFCEGRSKELKYDVKIGKAQIEGLKATIAKATADVEAGGAKLDELASGISSNEKELKEAVAMRKKESADFKAVEEELSSTIDSIERASSVLGREMAKGGSLAQLGATTDVTSALAALVDASAIASADAGRLTSLLQSARARSDAEDADDAAALGAPSGAVYESKSGGIVEALDGLQEKAEAQLAEARKAEATSQHNFAMTKQGLEDQIKFASKDLAETKQALSKNSETKATAQGDLSATAADVAEDSKNLKELEASCMGKAEEYEEESAARAEELKALGKAAEVVKEATGGAAEQTYALRQTTPSLLQVSARSRSPGLTAVGIVRRLSRGQHSTALAQLAARMESTVMRSDERDVFAKVKGMIEAMIGKLQDEASAEATQKAFCDKATAETTAKKEEASTTSEKMTSKIDQMSAATAKLTDEVAGLRKELSELVTAQSEMDKLRQEEKARYDKDKPELEMGIEGVKKAIQILREYYAKGDAGASSGAAGGIISLLEVAESDFSSGLAAMVAGEEKAAADYEAETKENEITKVTKDKDVEHKTKEITSLEKASAELKSDRDGVSEQLDAVSKYLEELEKQCVAKPESYEERTRRRAAELEGLKAALDALGDGEAPALLQRQRLRARRAVGSLRVA